MSAPAVEARPHQGRRITVVTIVVIAFLLCGIVLSAGLGQLDLTPKGVVGSILKAIGISNSWELDDPMIEASLWKIRFARLTMSLLVGALLAVAGTVMQAIFGNPLAEPGVVGVSSGAALGAAIAIAANLTFFGVWTSAVAAFIGGTLATFLVYVTARQQGRTEVVTLLLTGIAVNAFCGAGLALVMFMGSNSSREQIVFWQLGTMNGARWSQVIVVAVIGIPAAIVAVCLGRKYDLLALGDKTAAHLGIRVERLRTLSVILVALLTSVAVAFVGIIAFVGLVVPHAIRMILGPAHRTLLLVSALAGAALLVYADLVARTLVKGADLPIGLLTSLIGGPFFFWLIRRNRKSAGGWG